MPSPVRLAETDAEIARCFSCMQELRTHLEAGGFVERVRAQQAESGYRIAYLEDDGAVACVAGFRIASFLAWGRILYVDDLSTSVSVRRRGHGSRMVEWLFAHAQAQGCAQVHLDSGVQRHEAHRLYLAKLFRISSHHFSLEFA